MKKGAGSMAGTLMHFSPSQESIAVNNFKHIKDKTKQKPLNMFWFPISALMAVFDMFFPSTKAFQNSAHF